MKPRRWVSVASGTRYWIASLMSVSLDTDAKSNLSKDPKVFGNSRKEKKKYLGRALGTSYFHPSVFH
jgi:hypothetical protein